MCHTGVYEDPANHTSHSPRSRNTTMIKVRTPAAQLAYRTRTSTKPQPRVQCLSSVQQAVLQLQMPQVLQEATAGSCGTEPTGPLGALECRMLSRTEMACSSTQSDPLFSSRAGRIEEELQQCCTSNRIKLHRSPMYLNVLRASNQRSILLPSELYTTRSAAHDSFPFYKRNEVIFDREPAMKEDAKSDACQG